MKKYILCLLGCFLFLSGCSFWESETPMSKEDAQAAAISCLEAHKADMEAIIQSGSATGKAPWCSAYHLLSNGEYEFVLQHTGFTGTNTKTGVLYLPNDTPPYAQDANNPNIYSYASGNTVAYFTQRIEENWFFFYYEYDF